MNRVLENAALTSFLDCQNHNLLNVGNIEPVPTGMLGEGDPRLSDQRNMTPGSVKNVSVAATAGIQQSKLNLDGTMPVAWLGSGPKQAAKGSLVERIANRNVVGGYCALDVDGRVPVANMPSTGPQAGTVTSISLSPVAVFNISGSPITGTGPFALSWALTPDQSWLGVTGPDRVPGFTTTKVPVDFVPNLDGSQFTSGTFVLARLPAAVGMGAGHAQGITPDTGDDQSTGFHTDYLARDMTWKAFTNDISYQPKIDAPNIFLQAYTADKTKAYVTIRTFLPGASLFYMINQVSDAFIEASSVASTAIEFTLLLNVGDRIDAYAAKAGYNNSPVSTYRLPPP